MRYVFTVGEDENGPVVCGDDGLPIVAYTMDTASKVAKVILASPDMLPGAGVFVMKLLPVAFYLPVTRTPNGPVVDETIVHPEKKDDDDGSQQN